MSASRWTSRKFLTTFIAQLAGLAVLFWPQHETIIHSLADSVAALAVVLVSTVTYVWSEASIDQQRVQAQT